MNNDYAIYEQWLNRGNKIESWDEAVQEIYARRTD
jgi:hypothetical protein